MLIADLHIHSKYSRATSRDCVPEHLDFWARRKGINLVGTGDFTHPAWREELRDKLCPAEDGLYQLKEEHRLGGGSDSPRFVVSGEISSIYKKNGKVRKVHNLILLPGLEAAQKLSERLETIGNLHSDGRPILGLDSRDLLEITLEVCPNAIFIPAHIWTPHFSLFGAFSGFDTIEECFGDLTPYIHALETGLSSNPPMNWRLSALDSYILVSNSDAHSPAKLGREATLLDIGYSYESLYQALNGSETGYGGTLEFFPEEGKYHLDGHRKCGLCLTPAETEQNGGKCPVCGKKITIGVLHRVEQLADREEGFHPEHAGHFESIVPLPEVIAASCGLGAASKKVVTQYEEILGKLGSEFHILRHAPLEDIRKAAGPLVEEGIRRMRQGKVNLTPGYDGEYGKIKLLAQSEISLFSGQISFAPLPEKKAESNRTARKAHKIAREEFSQQLEIEPLPSKENALNPQQEKAVRSVSRAVAVIAGPGTGKTRTLVSRIVYLVRESGISPSEITAVTYTNKAAREMIHRLSNALGQEAVSAMRIGTFHGICLDFLSQNGTPPVVLDEYAALIVASEVREALSLKISAKKFLDDVSGWKNGLPVPEIETLEQAASLYQYKLSQYGAVDYDDILLAVLHMWEEGKTFPIRHLLIDEFQDINETQYRLVQKWGNECQSVFLIGDPDQSIYGFRGSGAAYFQRFIEEHPQTEQVRLYDNYRSTPQILSSAIPLIAKNPLPGAERRLKAREEPGDLVKLVRSQSDLSEAIYVAKEINRLVGGVDMLDSARAEREEQGLGFSDFAVLYRTHRQAAVLESCLRKEGIPYTVSGRERFLTEPLVRGLLSFFQYLLCPWDVLSLKICLKDLFGGDENLVRHLPVSRIIGCNTAEECYKNLPAAFQKEEVLERWRRLSEQFSPRVGQEPPQSLIEKAAEELGLEDQACVTRLSGVACFYNSMAKLLLDLKLGREGDITRSGGGSYQADAVSLMTLHASKGLEYPIVFMCGINKGVLPLEAGETDIQEERRLCYVGMTRAQKQLYLSTCGESSSFLEEIPKNTLIAENSVEHPPQVQQLRFF